MMKEFCYWWAARLLIWVMWTSRATLGARMMIHEDEQWHMHDNTCVIMLYISWMTIHYDAWLLMQKIQRTMQVWCYIRCKNDDYICMLIKVWRCMMLQAWWRINDHTCMMTHGCVHMIVVYSFPKYGKALFLTRWVSVSRVFSPQPVKPDGD